MLGWWMLACGGKDGDRSTGDATTDGDADTDADGDTDADSDADTDTDRATAETGATAATAETADSGTVALPLDGADFAGIQVLLDAEGSCADAFFYAVDSGAHALFRVDVSGATALANGGVYHAVIDLSAPPPEVAAQAQTGARLTGNLCGGAYNPYGGPIVQDTWTVTSGTLDLTLDATAGGYGGTAELVLTNVVLAAGPVRAGRIDRLEIHGATFPFFPP